MKAAILVDLNHPLEVAELALPRLDIGQVKVQLHCSTICGAQVGEISGIKGRDKFLPHLLGHEGGGVVLEVGPGVTLVKPGDHVVLHWRKGAGIQSSTPRYQWEGRTVNAGWVATFADQAIVSENRITRIEDDIPFEIASLLGCAVTTALGLLNRDAKVQICEAVADRVIDGEIMPLGNVHASIKYQKHLSRVLTVRALLQAFEEAEK